MKRVLPFALGLMFAGSAFAQSGFRPASATVVGPPGTQVIRVPASQLASGSLPILSNAVQSSGGTSAESLLTGYPVPGLGFDYTHFAAVNGDLAKRALVDPVTQQKLALARQIRRETPVAPAAFPAVLNNIQIVIVQQPPVVILPIADEEDARREPRRRRRYAEEERSERAAETEPLRLPASFEAPRTPAAPPREVSELVFVRRDGGLVFAVAYVQHGDHVVYVTREGHRQSLSMQLLDVAATRDMNESMGTTLNLQ